MAANTTDTQTRSNGHPAPPAPQRPVGAPTSVTAPGHVPASAAPADGRPAAPAGTQPRRSATAGEAVLAYLRFQARTLASLEPSVRADEFDAVHQMRVATRRLRAALRSFGDVIPRQATGYLYGELQWLGRALGAARDADVLAGHLRDSLRPTPPELLIGPVRARVQGHYAPRRAAARTDLLEVLYSPRYATLLAELDRVAAGPALGPRAGEPARDVLPAGVRRACRQAQRRMRRARHTRPGEARDVALHQARKSARRARYAAEAATPVIGKQARRFARQMKKVQSVLGDHQDSVLARQAARDLGISAHLAGENAFSYGLLHERESHRAERLQARARRVWRHAARPRYRRWMN
jgi:CHAD domain-containing protein